MPEFLQRNSPAKINVFLEVHGKRADGFHELETVMLRTDLCDVITFERCDTQRLSLHMADTSSPEAARGFPLDDSNLILRAATSLLESQHVKQGARIVIDKKIPAEAGLAGGSSNAATALMGLNLLWNLDLSLRDLHRIAANLGSDINFFLADSEAAVCRGRGEQVTPIPVGGELHFVAARPSTGNATAEVFSRLPPGTEFRTSSAVVEALRTGSPERLSTAIHNRLTPAAAATNPEMAAMIQQMRVITNRPVFMSGSGSTCFVVCVDQRDSENVVGQCGQLDVPFLTRLKCVESETDQAQIVK